MIAWHLIAIAGALTGIRVAIAGALVHWDLWHWAVAGVGAFALIVGWRAFANATYLNEDVVFQLTSPGDCGCLFTGALAPAVLGEIESGSAARRFVPAIVGGLAGFVINVVIL
jgi:hypothetical protein